MALLDELVQEEDLDPEVMGQTSSTFKNLPELEKIRRLIQMDLLEESHLLRKMSDRYNLPLLSTTLDEVQNYENLPLSKQLYERTGILPMRLGSKCACLLSVSVKLVEDESGCLSSRRIDLLVFSTTAANRSTA